MEVQVSGMEFLFQTQENFADFFCLKFYIRNSNVFLNVLL